MSKQEFLDRLRKGLFGYPTEDIEERLHFYGEMIDDRIDEGVSEEEAVEAIGTVEEIVEQIIADTPFAKIAIEKMKPNRKLKVWEIILLVLGSPIWFSLGIAAVAVIFSFYIILGSIIASLWSVFGALVGGALGGVVAMVFFACYSNVLSGVFLLACGFVCAGLSIFVFYACKAITKGFWVLTQKIAIRIKNCFIHQEAIK